MEDEEITAQERQILSPEEVAQYLGCGRTFAFKLLARGDIPSFTIGRLRRVRRTDLDRYIAERLDATR
jgi:excisionase family DNA binding protein